MKKIIALVMCLALMLSAAAASGENIYETLSGLEWTFSSGAGGWSTEMRIMADGSFTGQYHDSEMGEAADEYPDGTVYFCAFKGQLGPAEQADGNTWKIRVEKLEKEEAAETVEDGVRYVPAEAYGISEGDEMLLYAPGTPVSALSEEMQFWAHVLDQETPPTELEDWFLMSEKNNSGFAGYTMPAAANPWEDLTAEQLAAESGLAFGVPEGAENVIYRYMRGEGMAEMQFSWEGGEYCARILPMAQEGEGLTDISGMYYDWINEEPVTIGDCPGSIAQAQDGEAWVERCLWYDAAAGRMYSLSVTDREIDGLDLTVLADQVYHP